MSAIRDNTTNPATTQHENPPTTVLPQCPPPPYDNDSDDDDELPEDNFTITINTSPTIIGTGNLVSHNPTDDTRLVDAAAKASLWLAQSFKSQSTLNSIHNLRVRPLHLNLTINYGARITGHKNVIGNVCVKPKGAVDLRPSEREVPTATAGAKRKADDDGEQIQKMMKSNLIRESNLGKAL